MQLSEAGGKVPMESKWVHLDWSIVVNWWIWQHRYIWQCHSFHIIGNVLDLHKIQINHDATFGIGLSIELFGDG